LLDQTGQRHALFRLKLLVVSWGALHLRTLQGCRCCTSLLNPPVVNNFPESGVAGTVSEVVNK